MTDIRIWLAAWLTNRAPDISLPDTENFFTAGAIDSFGVIEFIEDIERQFDIRFTQLDFQDRRFSSIAGLTEIITEKKTRACV